MLFSQTSCENRLPGYSLIPRQRKKVSDRKQFFTIKLRCDKFVYSSLTIFCFFYKTKIKVKEITKRRKTALFKIPHFSFCLYLFAVLDAIHKWLKFHSIIPWTSLSSLLLSVSLFSRQRLAIYFKLTSILPSPTSAPECYSPVDSSICNIKIVKKPK